MLPLSGQHPSKEVETELEWEGGRSTGSAGSVGAWACHQSSGTPTPFLAWASYIDRELACPQRTPATLCTCVHTQHTCMHMHAHTQLFLQIRMHPSPPCPHLIDTSLHPSLHLSIRPTHVSLSIKSHLCPWTDEWFKKMWYTYTVEYYSAIKRMK